MDSTALRALHKSIKKWKQVAAGTLTEAGARTCPLCHEYFQSGCKGCPIKVSTGQVQCRSTPFHPWMNHFNRVHKSATRRVHSDCPDCVKLANDEVDFLKSLLPTKEAK